MPSIAVTLLWLAGALYAGIAIHELGHWAGARLMSLRVLACGIGVGKPLLVLPAFGTRFYLGWPPTGGLTIMLPERLAPERARVVVALLAGPAANLALGAVAAAAWLAGEQTGAAIVGAVSLGLGLTSLVPFSGSLGGLPLQSDGASAIDHWRRTADHRRVGGQGLRVYEALRELCRRLGSREGVTVYGSLAASVRIDLGDLGGARQILAEDEDGSRGAGPLAGAVRRLVELGLATAERPAEAEPVIEAALAEAGDDPLLVAILRLEMTAAALEAGRPAADLARTALEACRRSGLPHLVTHADCLLLEADPPPDVRAAAEEILSRKGARRPLRTVAVRLAVSATRIAAARGSSEDSRRLLRRAVDEIAGVASGVADQAAKSAFLARWTDQLRQLEEALGTPLRESLSGAGQPDRGGGSRAGGILAFVALALAVSGTWRIATAGVEDSFHCLGALLLLASAFCVLGSWVAARSVVPANGFTAGLLAAVVVLAWTAWAPWTRRLEAGREALAAGRYEEAERHFASVAVAWTRGHLSDREAIEPLEGLARAHMELGRNWGAEKVYVVLIEVAERVGAGRSEIRARVGLALARLRREGALDEVVEALRLCQENADIPLGDYFGLLEEYRVLLLEARRE